MAILTGKLSTAHIQSLRGIVDVYYDHGQLVARGWPRKARQPHSPAQKAHWAKMRRMHRWIKSNPDSWYQQIKHCSSSLTYSNWDRTCYVAWRVCAKGERPPMPDVEKMTLIHLKEPDRVRVYCHISTTDIFQYSNMTLRALDAKPHKGILRWFPYGEAPGRWGARRTKCKPPVDGALFASQHGYDQVRKILWADFEVTYPCLIVWPVFNDDLNAFTGASWLAGEPDFIPDVADKATPWRVPRIKKVDMNSDDGARGKPCWKNYY